MVSHSIRHRHLERRRAWLGGLCAGLFVVAACAGVGEPCGPEFRLTRAVGEVRDSVGAPLGWADVSLREDRGPQGSIVNVTFLAAPSGGSFPLPVGDAWLLATDGTVLASLPVATGTAGASRFVVLADASVAAELRTRLLPGGLRLEVVAGAQPARRLAAALQLKNAGDWERVICD